MTHKDVKFNNERIQIDGQSFDHCDFQKCELVFNGGPPPNMTHCSFSNDCTWGFDGNAQNTLQFLTALYHGGMKSLVENTFNNIRNNKTPTKA